MKDAKIFFATDIHGSDRCLRKFLNAGKFYGVDAVVMGGDITGKMIVPVVEEAGGTFSAQLFGRKRTVDADGPGRAAQVHRRRRLLSTRDVARGDAGTARRPDRGR